MPLACDGGNFSSPATHPDCGTPALTVEPGLVIQVGFFIYRYRRTHLRKSEMKKPAEAGFLLS